MTSKLQTLLLCVGLAIPADQLAKWWIVRAVPRGDTIPVIDGFFELVHTRNANAVFGLLGELPEPWRIGTFAGLTALVLLVVVVFFRDLAPGDRVSALALALILGGAVGNLTDRLLRGEVVDFLRFQLVGGFRWPDFNFADAYIVTGVGILAVELLATEGRSRAEVASHRDDA